MADFLEQAKAIWSTLNEMSERDPEEYKRFISEQLKDGNIMGFGSGSKATDKNGSNQKQAEPLEKVLEKLSLNSTSPKIVKKADEKRAKNRVKTDDKPGKPKVKEDKWVNLLDDEIGEKSMISNIVKKVPHSNSTHKGQGDDDESEVLITELRIPSGENVPARKNKNAPLIEEI